MRIKISHLLWVFLFVYLITPVAKAQYKTNIQRTAVWKPILGDTTISCFFPANGSKNPFDILSLLFKMDSFKRIDFDTAKLLLADSWLRNGIDTVNAFLYADYSSLIKENRNVKLNNFQIHPEEYFYQIFTYRSHIGDTILCYSLAQKDSHVFKMVPHNFVIQVCDGWIGYCRIWVNLTKKTVFYFDHNGDA